MWAFEAAGQLNDAAAYSPLIVTYRNGRPVRLAAFRDAMATLAKT